MSPADVCSRRLLLPCRRNVAQAPPSHVRPELHMLSYISRHASQKGDRFNGLVQ